MKLEIWSDILCPFCYIGKRKFEIALESFPHKEQVQIEWKSFQLDPSMEKQLPGAIDQYLASKKGITIEQAHQLNQHVTNLANEVGLAYHFDIAIPNNTVLAHRLLHYAKKYGKQNELKESLLEAYFTKGIDIGDIDSLSKIAASIGLDPTEASAVLKTNAFESEVELDQYHAQQIGVNGVPFFVFDNQYAVSGAQDPATFASVLEKVWAASAAKMPPEDNALKDAAACNIDGNC